MLRLPSQAPRISAATPTVVNPSGETHTVEHHTLADRSGRTTGTDSGRPGRPTTDTTTNQQIAAANRRNLLIEREVKMTRLKNSVKGSLPWLVIGLALAMMLAPPAVQARNIKVGIIDCYSGPPAVYGKDALNGFKMALEKINAALAGEPQRFEWQHIRYDNTPFEAEVSLNRVDVGGEVFLQAMVSDISERKAADEALRERELQFRTLFETANAAIFTMREDRFIDCNTKTLEMFGCTREQILG